MFSEGLLVILGAGETDSLRNSGRVSTARLGESAVEGEEEGEEGWRKIPTQEKVI